jgi:DNA/RNA endonuclease YhcR with UshA esterase domain
MTYPRPEQYSLAVQSPTIVFADPELKAASVQKNVLGLPVCASGGFALTYPFIGPSGRWAVRCFKQEIPDREERYRHISAFLQKCTLPYFVTTHYQRQGILVGDTWYPITKVGWVDGESLGYFVERHLNDPKRLKDLARQLLVLVNDLESIGVAHGDLQHGNVRIENEQLRLIDYDGMFVPSLAGKNACELGHRNYQHPRRSEQHFDSTLDRFSSIVIYLALLALAESPVLWNQYTTGGENLLFRAEDFADPHRSPLLSELERLPSVKALVPRFRDLCRSDVRDVPRLQDFLNGAYHLGKSTPAPTVALRPAHEVVAAVDRDLLLAKVGDIVEVVGEVTDYYEGTTRYGKPYLFLNFGHYQEGCFTIVVWSEALKFCEERGLQLTKLKGKWVSVTGLVQTYTNSAKEGQRRTLPPRPQIILEQPSQLQVFGSKTAAETRLQRARPKPNPADVFNALYKDRPVSRPRGPTTMAMRPAQQATPAAPTHASMSPHLIQSTQPPSLSCPSCGHLNPSGAGVCRSCRFHFPLDHLGNPLPSLPSPPSEASPPRWRRLISWITGR